eukprot:s4070_g7.t1
MSYFLASELLRRSGGGGVELGRLFSTLHQSRHSLFSQSRELANFFGRRSRGGMRSLAFQCACWRAWLPGRSFAWTLAYRKHRPTLLEGVRRRFQVRVANYYCGYSAFEGRSWILMACGPHTRA